MAKRWVAGVMAAVVCAGALAKAPPVKPNPRVADETMFEFLRAKDDAHAARLISEERKFLEIGALRSPEEVVVADVLLKRGFTGVSVRNPFTGVGFLSNDGDPNTSPCKRNISPSTTLA